MNNSEKSRILLLCIRLNSEPGSPQEVSIDDLFLVFHIFGKIQSIVIFSQKSPIKAFLEFSQIEEAERVKEAFHEKHLNAFGKIRVFPSPLAKLETSNKFLEVKDFSQTDQTEYLAQVLSKLNGEVRTAGLLKHSLSQKPPLKNVFKDDRIDETCSVTSNKPGNVFPPANQVLKQCFFNRQTSIANSQKRAPTERIQSQSTSQFGVPRTLTRPGYPSDAGLNRKAANKSSSGVTRKCFSFALRSKPSDERDIEKTIKSNLRFESKVTKSAVVLVSNLNCGRFSVEDMHHLASTCGNIKKLLMMPNLKKCLIEYKSRDFAHACLTMLNNQFFLGEKLKVNFSRYAKIDLRKNNRSCNSEKYNQVKRVNRKEWRFPAKESPRITFIAPSIFLLLKIVQNKKKSISHEVVFQHVRKEEFAPCQIKLIEDRFAEFLVEEYVNRGIWTPARAKRNGLLAIYKFKNLQESMWMLSKLHNSRISGKRLDVSFSFFKF